MAGNSNSESDNERRGRPCCAQNVVFYAICALIIGLAVWGTEPGLSPLSSPNPKDSYYNLLVQGFQAGQLNLKKEAPAGLAQLPDPYDSAAHAPYLSEVGDMSYYKGKLYLYFGITPVLILFGPYTLLTGTYLSDPIAGLIFCSAGYLTAAGLMFAIWRRHFPKVNAWVAITGIFIFGLIVDAQQIEWVRCRIYEVALSSAFMFVMITLAAIWRALNEPKESVLCLLLASLAYGLAIGSRPSLLPGAVILLVPVCQAWMEAAKISLRPRVGSMLAAAVGPITFIGAGLMLYNFLRFGNPLEFGYRYELTGRDQAVVSQFSLDNFWFNIRYYILEPIRWTWHFPFLHTVPPWPSSAGHLVPGLYYGGILFIGFPSAWLALAAVLTCKGSPNDGFSGLCWFVLGLFLVFAACALTLFLFLYATNRYELDFLPALSFLAFIGVLCLESVTADSPRLRSLSRLCWGLLFVYGAFANMCASFDAYATANEVAGNVLYNRGLMDEARERFQKALAFSPQDADAHGGLGNVLVKKGDIDGAITQYQMAVEQRPDFWEVYNNLGYCLLQAGRIDDAIIQYQKAIALRPQNATYHRGLGDAFLKKGMLDSAIVEFKKVLELEPESAEDSEHLGDAFFEKGMLSDAIVQYENAVAIKPDFAEAHNNLGYSLFMAGNLDAAIAQYGKAIELLPNFVQVYNNLGNAYRAKGMAARAIASYQKAIALQPQFIPAQRNLAWILATWPDAGIRDGNGAVALAGQANRLTGGRDPEILRTLAAAYAETGRFPEAIADAYLASSLAAAQSKTKLLNNIQGDIKLYQNHTPCRSNAAF